MENFFTPQTMQIGMLVCIFLVMYIFVLRPQNQKAKLHREMLTALRRGDQVLTAGGIIGTVYKLENDQEVQVEIAEGIRVRIAKATIAQVLSKTEPLKTPASKAVTKETSEDNIQKPKPIAKPLVQPRKKNIKTK